MTSKIIAKVISKSFVDLNTVAVLVSVLFVLVGIITFLFYKKYSEVSTKLKAVKETVDAFQSFLKVASGHMSKTASKARAAQAAHAQVCKVAVATPVQEKKVTIAEELNEEIAPYSPPVEKKVVKEEIVTEMDLNDLLESELSDEEVITLESDIDLSELEDDFDLSVEFVKKVEVEEEAKEFAEAPEL